MGNTAIAIKYYDVYERTGLYPVDLPAPMGCKSVGDVEAISNDVHEIKAGDRVTVLAGPGN